MPLTRSLVGLLVALGLLLLAAACSPTRPFEPSGPPVVADVAVEPGLFRVTVRWPGDPPEDRAALLLERCAQLTVHAGGSMFFVVNASEPPGHSEWLNALGVDAPVMLVPVQALTAGGSLTALVRVFPAGREPSGYRLYDAKQILRDRKVPNA